LNKLIKRIIKYRTTHVVSNYVFYVQIRKSWQASRGGRQQLIDRRRVGKKHPKRYQKRIFDYLDCFDSLDRPDLQIDRNVCTHLAPATVQNYLAWLRLEVPTSQIDLTSGSHGLLPVPNEPKQGDFALWPIPNKDKPNYYGLFNRLDLYLFGARWQFQAKPSEVILVYDQCQISTRQSL